MVISKQGYKPILHSINTVSATIIVKTVYNFNCSLLISCTENAIKFDIKIWNTKPVTLKPAPQIDWTIWMELFYSLSFFMLLYKQ